MNGRALAEIALRVWGLTLFLGAVASAPTALVIAATTYEGMSEAATLAERVGWAVQLLLRAALGAGLIRCGAAEVSGWIVPERLELRIEADARHLQTLGFALAGVFVLVAGLQDLGAAAYGVFLGPGREVSGPWPKFDYLWLQQRETLARGIIQVVAGTVLVGGRERIATGWLRLRGRLADRPRD